MSKQREKLKEHIERNVFQRFVDEGADRWIFDFRRVSMTREFMDLFAHEFFAVFPEIHDFQICGMESASIPLITALCALAPEYDRHATGLFIRKSRKKYDLAKALEGTVRSVPVILIDDTINSGKSIEQQIEILQKEHLHISHVFTIVRFRDKEFYQFLEEQKIRIVSLFELNDFAATLGVKNQKSDASLQPIPYTHIWGMKAEVPASRLKYVVPKSAPLLYRDALYVGTDAGTFFCLDAKNGKTRWQTQILHGDMGKYIFSSPCAYNDVVYFGAYDGNFYALDTDTGKRKWVSIEADWIGSSPCIAKDLGIVYVGLEYGLFRKKGGIAAFDANSGKVLWRDTHSGLTHSSPYYSSKNNLLFCGSNDGKLRIYNAKTGEKLKEHAFAQPIRASFSENADGTRVAFGAFDRKCRIIDTTTLEIVDSFEIYEAIYSTPLWVDDTLVVNGLDKRVYAYDTRHKKILWRFLTKGRIFANPILHDGHIWTGSNDGCLYSIDLKTGKERGHIQFPERIVNTVIFDQVSGLLYVPLFNSELHCLKIN